LGGLFRLIDANLNRLKEGIRVVEDISRFILNNGEIALTLKEIRHLATPQNNESSKYLKFRNVSGDPLKKSLQSENKRKNINDILIANLKRGQESARVLEESFKLLDIEESEKYKHIRYKLYDLEFKFL
jgi:thiamine-phosphate pyrophosphorylase